MLMIFSFSTRKTQLVVIRTCSATTKLLTLIKIINIDIRMILEIVLDTIEMLKEKIISRLVSLDCLF